MSEIEKMYKNANAYKNLCECAFKNLFDYNINYGQDVCIHVEDEIRNGCEGCELAEQNVKYYPPFTAEKQIAILCWFANFYGHITLSNKPKNITAEGLQESLARLINLYWTGLPPEQQQQVKGILE